MWIPSYYTLGEECKQLLLLDTPCAAGARSTSFPPAVPPEEIYLNHRFSLIRRRSRTSVQRQLIWCPNSHLVRSIMSMLRFWKFSSKLSQNPSPKEVPKVLPVTRVFINGDPLSDRSKLKVQTTSRQEPYHTPQIPFAKINYFLKNARRTDISFSSLPDGKSASRNDNDIMLVAQCHNKLTIMVLNSFREV